MVDLAQYLPILIFLGIALLLSVTFVFLPMLVGRLTGAHKPDPAKLSEYECGFPAFEEPRSQFDVRFYLVAILFIIFDLEAAFLYPWAAAGERRQASARRALEAPSRRRAADIPRLPTGS